MMRTGNRQRGFSAIAAVVMIVLFGLLGAYMATLTGVQSITTTLSAGTMQAWFAARSGIEWGVFQVTEDNDCFPDQTLELTEGATDRFQVSVACDSTAVFEAPNNYNVYTLTSTAIRGSVGTPGYVSRTIRVSVTGAE